MPRPPKVAPEEESRLVLAVLAGEVTVAEAARRAKVSETSMGKWKAQFIEGGRQQVAAGGSAGPNSRERQLLEELEEVRAALGEAHVELRVWKKAAEQLPPSRTSR